MSDYIYMLESHLSPEQNRVVEDVQAGRRRGQHEPLPDRRRHARHAGRLPDPRSGFRGGRQCAEGGRRPRPSSTGATGTFRPTRAGRAPSWYFPSRGDGAARHVPAGEVRAHRAPSRRFRRPPSRKTCAGATSPATPSRCRLNKASRGLLLDPMNGLADIERRELRAVSAYGFYDDPSRLLRLIRFGCGWASRWRSGRRCRWRTRAKPRWRSRFRRGVLAEELKRISVEDSPAEILGGA